MGIPVNYTENTHENVTYCISVNELRVADSEVKLLKSVELLSTQNGKREESAVTPAQHPVTMTSENTGVEKSWSRQYGELKLNEFDLPDFALFRGWKKRFEILKVKVFIFKNYGIRHWNLNLNSFTSTIGMNGQPGNSSPRKMKLSLSLDETTLSTLSIKPLKSVIQPL